MTATGCELLIRVVDRPQPDPDRPGRLTEAGDVLEVMPSGHPWSHLERANPDWRILALPVVPVEDALPLLDEPPGDDRVDPGRPRRARHLPPDHPAVAEAIRAGSADWTAAQLDAFAAPRPARPDPRVIG